MNEIELNYQQISKNINQAAAESGRNAEDICIVAVCKKQPIQKIKLAVEAGIAHLAENYPEQGIEKIQATASMDVTWHMIGHIQSRKVKLVAQYYGMVHSVDSLETMQKLDCVLQTSEKEMECMLELNLSGETTKSGFLVKKGEFSELGKIVQSAKQYQHLKLKGLMVMPPFTETGEASRPYFIHAKECLIYLQNEFPQMNIKYLSMGTSQDYIIAVQEGATHIRIGTALFGFQ